MRRIGVAVDPPSAARSPLRETTGRDGPYSSFSCTARGNDGKGPSLPVILPVSGGASAPKQARRGRAGQEEERRDRAFLQKRAPRGPFCGDARSRRGRGARAQAPGETGEVRSRAARQNKKGPPRVSPGRASARARENAPCWPAASCSPTDYTAVPSALGGLTSGFGTGPGVPPLPWPPANKGRSHPPAAPVRALRAAQRSKASLQGRDRDRMPSPRRREGG